MRGLVRHSSLLETAQAAGGEGGVERDGPVLAQQRARVIVRACALHCDGGSVSSIRAAPWRSRHGRVACITRRAASRRLGTTLPLSRYRYSCSLRMLQPLLENRRLEKCREVRRHIVDCQNQIVKEARGPQGQPCTLMADVGNRVSYGKIRLIRACVRALRTYETTAQRARATTHPGVLNGRGLTPMAATCPPVRRMRSMPQPLASDAIRCEGSVGV